jgi:hypothetical protein
VAAAFWAAQPNVALTGTVKGSNDTTLVVMMVSNPKYENGDLYFDAVLEDPAPLGPNAQPSKLTRAPPGSSFLFSFLSGLNYPFLLILCGIYLL